MLRCDEESIPQGLKPDFVVWLMRPKAEALGYLEARATTNATAKAKYGGSSLRSE
jgi:hypothetical protein